MTKFVFKLEQKGLFQALGLHHASVALSGIVLGRLVGAVLHIPAGDFMAVFAIGWYANREYGNGPYPPKEFEYMDLISPALVAIGYLQL